MPHWLEPMAATLTQERFTGPDWLFERKFDGIRLLAYKSGGEVQLYSRNRLPQDLPDVAAAVAALPVDEVVLDGEATWDEGRAYHVFDILWLNGRDVTALPLEKRRALLARLPFDPPLQRVDLIDDPQPWDRARREGWEGVIAKRRGSPYEHRRSKLWLKMKCELAHDFVFAGKIGTGFDTELLLELRTRLDAIELPASPFTKAKGLPRLRANFVRPDLVVRVGFIEWTRHGKLRHPRLLGFATHTSPRSVVRSAP